MREIKHKVIINGIPESKNIPKEHLNMFCDIILKEIEEYYSKQPKTIL